MAFNDQNQYTPSHKVWDHVGNLLPDVEHSEGERPAHEFKPAAWLPVKFYDKHYENWYTVMPGKIVALDPDGRVMPAQYGLTSQDVVYTANDVAAGVIDIATGLPVTTAKTVTLANLDGVRDATWTQANAGVGAVTSGFMGRFGSSFSDASRKYPVGVAPYGYLQWAGDGSSLDDGFNPAGFRLHNYNMQHQVAVLCDYVLKLPLVPAQEATETVEQSVSGANLVFGTRDTHTRAQAQSNATGRYNASTGYIPVLSSYPVIALALDEQDVAKNTSRTTITMQSSNTADDLSSILVSERSSLSAVKQAGDFWVDYPVGVIFIYSSDGATVPTAISGAAGTVSVTYYRNGSAPGTRSVFASVHGGGIKPGDFLKVGADSDWVIANPASDNVADILGQVLALDNDHPKDYLDRVRTAYNPALNTDASGSMANATLGSTSANLGQLDQMPGSANGGYPDNIHYAGAADTLVIVNLITR